jgi:Thioredoxin
MGMLDESKTISGIPIHRVMTFHEYLTCIEDLFHQGLATGNHQGEDYLEYTKMNLQRMHRWEKTYHPSEAMLESLSRIQHNQRWYIITEGWCGDSAQNLVAIEHIASSSPFVSTHYLFRDENPAWIERFHTEGAHSIPKVIMVNDAEEVISTWGPRPSGAAQAIVEWKTQDLPLATWKPLLHKWYADDKQHALERDFMQIIQNQIAQHATR